MNSTFWVSHEDGFYFRIFGYGIAAHRDFPVRFSERYGYRGVWRVGRWSFTWLKRSELPKTS